MQEIYKRLKQENNWLIGIADADLLDHGTRHPNLALLKISAWCKNNGHQVELLRDYNSLNEYDAVFLSCVFSFTFIDKSVLNRPNVFAGGQDCSQMAVKTCHMKSSTAAPIILFTIRM